MALGSETPRRRWAGPGMLLICCAVAFLCYGSSYTRLPVVPLYARSLGLGTSAIGRINAAFFLVAGFLSMPLGRMSDRLGRKRLACAGLLLLSTSSGLLALSTSFAQILGTYILLGLGVAAFGPTMMSLVADVAPPSQLGRSYGWYTLALYGGMSLGPALGGTLARLLGYRPVFVVAALLLLGTFAVAVLFLSPGETIAPSEGAPEGPSFGEMLRNRPLRGCLAATMGACFGLGMFVTYLPLHAQNRGLDVGKIGLVFLVQGACNAMARLPAGRLSDRVPDRRVLVILGLGGFALSMLILGFAGDLQVFVLGAVAMGFSMAVALTSIAALVVEVTPRPARGLAMGAYNTSIFLGMMLNSVSVGPLAEAAGMPAGFVATALVNLVLCGLFCHWIGWPAGSAGPPRNLRSP